MSNAFRAVTRARRSARWLRRSHPRPHRPARWRTPAPGRPLPPFTVTRRPAKRRGGQAPAMGFARRAKNYGRQNGGHPSALTPAQSRRWQRKYNRAADPRGIRDRQGGRS